MKIFAQIIGGSTPDSFPNVLIFFDNKRYLFNCGEGTQRFCTEYKVKLTKIRTIFMTRLSWENLGGLPGMLLTVSDVGTTKLALAGPPNTLNFIEALRYFVARMDLQLNVSEFTGAQGEDWKDDLLRVVPLLVYSSDATKEDPMDASSSPANPEGKVACHISPAENGFTKHSSDVYLRTVHPNTKKRKLHEDPANLPEETTPTIPAEPVVAQLPPPPVFDPNASFAFSATHLLVHRKRPPLFKNRPDTKPIACVTCYACHMPEIPGKFDGELATKLGVPPGPLRGKLVKGESVTTASGRVVTAAEVIAPPTPGQVFLIVHCPDKTYIENLINHSLMPDYCGPNAKYPVPAVLHISPHEVLDTPAYKAWSNSFPATTQHIVANNESCGKVMIFNSAAKNQTVLNSLHPNIFPAPAFSPETTPIPAGLPKRTVANRACLKMHLSPILNLGLDDSEVIPTHDQETIIHDFYHPRSAVVDPEAMAVETSAQAAAAATAVAPRTQPAPDILAKVDQFKKALAKLRDSGMVVDDKGVHVTFLGTGSAIPSKYRNVSSTYVMVENKGILFDAGEGTLGQLFRRYGKELPMILETLKCVFISHMHADHHLGLIKILTRRKTEFPHLPPVTIVAPGQFNYWLQEYKQIEAGIEFSFIDSFDVMTNPQDPARKQYFLDLLGLTEVALVPVVHCQDAYAIAITHKNDWKIVFSGDTRPCKELIAAGANCTLLIHEATFEDSMHQEAAEKRHSTTAEAIKSAVAMKAQFLMMNHFSQRYPKVPVFAEDFVDKAGIAFDLMTVRFSDFPILPKFLPVLQDLFSQEDEEEKQEEDLTPEQKKAITKDISRKAKLKKWPNHDTSTEQAKGSQQKPSKRTKLADNPS